MNKLVVSKKFSIKPDKDSSDSKVWTLELTIPEGTTEMDLARAVLASEVIKVQNGNRSKFDKLPNGHLFKKIFAKPGVDVDPEAEIMARAENDIEYAKALLAKLQAKLDK